ncbi:MAG TPA: ParA family protein [Vicinamibacteria bacterium]|nr:ParA family protein [Vicinamibacteria bacterium]
MAPDARHARVVAIANRKGGVAKTTTAVNLGAALSERGRRVLLVDLDPQQDLCSALRVPMPRPGLADAILSIALFGTGSLADAMVRAHGLVVAGGYGIADAEKELGLHKNGENALKRALAPHLERFDFVILDCAPSLQSFTASALACARDVIVPVQTEFLAANQLPGIMSAVDDIRSRLNPGLKVAGFLPTMFDGRSRHALEVMERIANQAHLWGVRAFKPIPKSIRFSEASSAGIPILKFAPESSSARAYGSLAADVDLPVSALALSAVQPSSASARPIELA